MEEMSQNESLIDALSNAMLHTFDLKEKGGQQILK